MKHTLLRLLCRVSVFLKCVWLFFPGILFLLLAIFAFWTLPQGKDVVLICLEGGLVRGAVCLLAIYFWAMISWYSARLIAYNNDDLFNTVYRSGAGTIRIGEMPMFHFPRVLGYLVFAVTIIAFASHDQLSVSWPKNLLMLAGYITLYLIAHRLFTLLQRQAPASLRNITWYAMLLIIGASIAAVVCWNEHAKWVIVLSLSIAQHAALLWVVVRNSAAHQSPATGLSGQGESRNDLIGRFITWSFGKERLQKNPSLEATERTIFSVFNAVALLSGFCYLLCILSLKMAQSISVLPFVFLAFGILLGIGNFITLVSHRRGINIHVLLFALMFCLGLFIEPHDVRLLEKENAHAAIDQRPGLRSYLHAWANHPSRRDSILNTQGTYPVFIVLADGGASRSGYWTVSVLSRLSAATMHGHYPFQRHLFCLSGASGGSVGEGTFIAAFNTSEVWNDSAALRKHTAAFLRSDFLSYTLTRLLGPDLLNPLAAKIFGGDRAEALTRSFNSADTLNPVGRAISRGITHYIPDTSMQERLIPAFCFNTTRMQDGRPGVVANIRINEFSERIDVLAGLPHDNDLSLSSGMILSARFPYISPAGRIGDSYYVDGGYFDNSGAGFAHEMLMEIHRCLRDSLLPREDDMLVRKLRFYVIHITNTPYRTGSEQERVHPALNDFLAPVLTLAGSYASQTNINDARLEKYINDYYKARAYIRLNLYLKDAAGNPLQESFPMNWVISKKVLQIMDERVYHIPALNSIITRLNEGYVNGLFSGLDESKNSPNTKAVAPADNQH